MRGDLVSIFGFLFISILMRKGSLSETILRGQLKFIGKCLGSTMNLLAKKYIFYYPEYGRRKRGRPRLTFVDYIEKLTNIKISKIAKLANNKSELFISMCCISTYEIIIIIIIIIFNEVKLLKTLANPKE
jgi:hypothetical protein